MTDAVDLTDLDMWARGAPYDEFARLRRESPVAWHDEAPPNSGFWSVCGYADIVAASRDVGTFSSARGAHRPQRPLASWTRSTITSRC